MSLTDGQRVIYGSLSQFTRELVQEIDHSSAMRDGRAENLRIFAKGRCELILRLIDDLVKLGKEDAGQVRTETK